MPGRRHKKQNGNPKQLTLWSAREETPPLRTERVPQFWLGCRVHLLGIGGIGMSGIARLLHGQGALVRGCDAGPSAITRALQARGIEVTIGHSPAHLEEDTDVVIASAAVRNTNPELRAAQRRGIEVMKYAQVLGRMMADRDGVAVSGSHGKTTTTSMIAYAMSLAGKDPSMVIGGLVPQLGGNSHSGSEGPFVVEACEYDRSFLNLSPRAGVITNVERDHMDYYTGLDDLVEAFGKFAGRVRGEGLVAVNGDDPNALRAAEQARATVETFGLGRDCTWRIGEWSRENGVTRFRLYYKRRVRGRYELLVPGLYNIRNAVACLAVCAHFGISKAHAAEALATFRGVRRRFDRLGEVAGVMVLDDYGHHPTEVQVTLDAVRKEFPRRRLVCVFQPHQCSRTRLFLNEFAQSLTSADRVIVPDIYSVRDTAADRRSVHARDLVKELRANGVNAAYHAAYQNVVDELLNEVQQGDLVMTMGAGPVDDVGRKLLSALEKRDTGRELVSQS